MTCQNVASCTVLAMQLGIYWAKLWPIITEDAITILRFTTDLFTKVAKSSIIRGASLKRMNYIGEKLIILYPFFFLTNVLYI